jgi:hypothetical protein
MENWKKKGIEENLYRLKKYSRVMIKSLDKQDGMYEAGLCMDLIKTTVETLAILMDDSDN